MRHKLITNVRTRLRGKRQLVIVVFENNDFVFLSAGSIKSNTSLEVNELELLIGSRLRITYYKNGEQTTIGTICTKDNLLVKEFFFELQKPVEKLRIENRSQLLPFQKIRKIFYFFKFERDNVGIETEDGNVTFITLKRFESQSHIEQSEQHILVGSYIFPEYYKIGDKLSDGDIIRTNKVLKQLNLRYSSRVENMHENFENRITYYDGHNYYSSNDNGPEVYGYNSWEEMAFNEAFEGNIDAWNEYNQ